MRTPLSLLMGAPAVRLTISTRTLRRTALRQTALSSKQAFPLLRLSALQEDAATPQGRAQRGRGR
jgi:hypothetical protein